jgi:hypothetical protein
MRKKFKGAEVSQVPQVAGEIAPTLPDTIEKTRYSHGIKAAIYSDHRAGMTTREISYRYRVSARLVDEVIHDPQMFEMLDEGVAEHRKKSLMGLFYYIADIAFAGLGKAEIMKLPAAQRATVGAIAYDKARLAEGLSTENVSIRGVLGDIRTTISDIRKRRGSTVDFTQPRTP